MKFTSQNLSYTNPKEDCYLDPSDPLYHLIYPGKPQVAPAAQEHFKLREQAAKQGIRPGTPAWFALTQANR
jgi:hypothetical protein